MFAPTACMQLLHRSSFMHMAPQQRPQSRMLNTDCNSNNSDCNSNNYSRFQHVAHTFSQCIVQLVTRIALHACTMHFFMHGQTHS